MRWLTDTRSGDWIGPRLSGWGTVGGVVPRGFDAYARILHPVGATQVNLAASARDEWGYPPLIGEATWRWADVARRTGAVMHPLVQWHRLAGEDRQPIFDDGWRPEHPREGFFDPDSLAQLSILLGRHTDMPEELTFGVWVGWGQLNGSSVGLSMIAAEDGVELSSAELERLAEEAAAVYHAEREASVADEIREAVSHASTASEAAVLELPGREYVLGRVSAPELGDPTWPRRAGMGWVSGLDGPMPQLLWPADRAWCVASEIDFDSTLVGGSRQLITAILADANLESFEVGPDDDLSSEGDTLNPPRA